MLTSPGSSSHAGERTIACIYCTRAFTIVISAPVFTCPHCKKSNATAAPLAALTR